MNPEVVGTVLFRPSALGGAFRGAPRLVLAAALSARPDVAVVRVNHKRNIVAADTTTQACLEELMAVTELHGIPVTARLPVERGRSTGFLYGVDTKPADKDLLEAIESSVLVVSATREGNTVTIRFAGPVPPEHVSLFKLWFRVRPARPRLRQCGRFGHVLESYRWPTSCITCGKSHAAGSPCQTVCCVNCGGPHTAGENRKGDEELVIRSMTHSVVETLSSSERE